LGGGAVLRFEIRFGRNAVSTKMPCLTQGRILQVNITSNNSRLVEATPVTAVPGSPGSGPPALVRAPAPATSKAMAAKEARLKALGFTLLGAHRQTPLVDPQKTGPESPRRGSSIKKRAGESQEAARGQSVPASAPPTAFGHVAPDGTVNP